MIKPFSYTQAQNIFLLIIKKVTFVTINLWASVKEVIIEILISYEPIFERIIFIAVNIYRDYQSKF